MGFEAIFHNVMQIAVIDTVLGIIASVNSISAFCVAVFLENSKKGPCDFVQATCTVAREIILVT